MINAKNFPATIHVDGLETVSFGESTPYYAVRNDGDDTIYASVIDPSCSPDAEGVYSILPHSSLTVRQGYKGTTLYLNGSGKAFIEGTYMYYNPFVNGGKGGGGSGGRTAVTLSDKSITGTSGVGVYIGSDGVCVDTYAHGTNIDIYYLSRLKRTDKIYVYNENPDLYGIFQTYGGVSYDDPNPYLIGKPFSSSGIYDVPEGTAAVFFCYKNNDVISGLYDNISNVTADGTITYTV